MTEMTHFSTNKDKFWGEREKWKLGRDISPWSQLQWTSSFAKIWTRSWWLYLPWGPGCQENRCDTGLSLQSSLLLTLPSARLGLSFEMTPQNWPLDFRTISKCPLSMLMGKIWVLYYSFLPVSSQWTLCWVSCWDSSYVPCFHSRSLLVTEEGGISQRRASLSCVCLFVATIFLFELLEVLNEVLIEREMPFATLKIRNFINISINSVIATIICMLLRNDLSEHLFKHHWNQKQNCGLL